MIRYAKISVLIGVIVAVSTLIGAAVLMDASSHLQQMDSWNVTLYGTLDAIAVIVLYSSYHGLSFVASGVVTGVVVFQVLVLVRLIRLMAIVYRISEELDEDEDKDKDAAAMHLEIVAPRKSAAKAHAMYNPFPAVCRSCQHWQYSGVRNSHFIGGTCRKTGCITGDDATACDSFESVMKPTWDWKNSYDEGNLEDARKIGFACKKKEGGEK